MFILYSFWNTSSWVATSSVWVYTYCLNRKESSLRGNEGHMYEFSENPQVPWQCWAHRRSPTNTWGMYYSCLFIICFWCSGPAWQWRDSLSQGPSIPGDSKQLAFIMPSTRKVNNAEPTPPPPLLYLMLWTALHLLSSPPWPGADTEGQPLHPRACWKFWN